MKDFETGDTVTIGQHGTVQWKLMSKAGRNTFVCRSLSSGKIYPYSTALMKLVNPEPNQGRSELYKLLPRAKDWNGKYFAVDSDRLSWFYNEKPDCQDKSWDNKNYTMNCIITDNKITLPPSISWRDTLVSREEMEAWEKSQDVIEKLKDNFNQAIDEHLSKTETPQQKVERLKLELEEAEKELEKMKPIELSKVDGYSVDSVFIGYGQNIVPDGMVGKCLMFNRHKYKMEVLEHNEYTVLTFFKL